MQTRYVDPDSSAGGNGTTNALSGANRAYASMSEWEAARQAVLSEVEELICESNGGSHTADTTACVVNGWTTTASFYIDIKTSAAARHAGVYSTSKYRLEVSNGICLDIHEEYVRVTGLQFKVTKNGTAGTSAGIRTDEQFVTAGQIFDSNIAVGVISGTNSGNAHGFYLNDASTDVRNCIAHGFINGAETHYGFRFWPSTGTTNARNCTVYNCNTGYRREAGTIALTNCGAAACSTAFGGSPTQTTCSSSTPTFVSTTGGSEDLHLQGGDTTWKDQGTDLSATFTLDIDGQTRSGTWDIGADEYQSSGSTNSGAGASSGTVSCAGVGAAAAAGAGAASSSTTPTAVGASTAASVGSAAVTGAANGVGSSTAACSGSSTGSGTGASVGACTSAAIGSAEATAACSGISESSIGAGAASATVTVSGSGRAIAAGAGAVAATTSGAAVATGIGSGQGLSAATAAATGVAASVAAAAGMCSATIVVAGAVSCTVAFVGVSTMTCTAFAFGDAGGVELSAAEASLRVIAMRQTFRSIALRRTTQEART